MGPRIEKRSAPPAKGKFWPRGRQGESWHGLCIGKDRARRDAWGAEQACEMTLAFAVCFVYNRGRGERWACQNPMGTSYG